jgi:hypothetical protein
MVADPRFEVGGADAGSAEARLRLPRCAYTRVWARLYFPLVERPAFPVFDASA